jgi:hypothetical protein
MESRLELVQTLSLEEMVIINGGTVTPDDAYQAGYAAGQYVQKVIAGVGILMFFWAL